MQVHYIGQRGYNVTLHRITVEAPGMKWEDSNPVRSLFDIPLLNELARHESLIDSIVQRMRREVSINICLIARCYP